MAAGKVMVVGIGPGSAEYLTHQGMRALQESELVIGYRLYVKQVGELACGKEIISSGMSREVERCRLAMSAAAKGKKVALVSGGDSGVYGMAGLLLQVVQEEAEKKRPEVEIIPGVTAATAAAAVLGAPLTHDFAVVSLSDALTPWELIAKRLHAAGEADYVTVIYNPRSRGRRGQLSLAREILLQHRRGDTPVGIVRNAGREGQAIFATTLKELTRFLQEVDMSAVLFVGNSCSYWQDGRMITPRGYRL